MRKWQNKTLARDNARQEIENQKDDEWLGKIEECTKIKFTESQTAAQNGDLKQN